MSNRNILDTIYICVTSIYIACVAVWLLITHQIPETGVIKIIKSIFRQPYAGTLMDIRKEQGHCWWSPLPEHLLSDLESASTLMLYENGNPLGPAHSSHDDIRKHGRGRFSHWGSEVYFSTSDNSDPSNNNKSYTVKEIR